MLVIYFGRLQIQVIDNRQEHVEQHKVYDHFEQQKENWTHHRVNFVYSLKVKFTKQNKGKAFYTGLKGLGEMIFTDYEQNRKKRIR